MGMFSKYNRRLIAGIAAIAVSIVGGHQGVFANEGANTSGPEQESKNSNIVRIPVPDFDKPPEQAQIYAGLQIFRLPSPESFSVNDDSGSNKFAFIPALEGRYFYIEFGITDKRVLTLVEPFENVESPYISDWRQTEFEETWIADAARYCADVPESKSDEMHSKLGKPNILHCVAFTNDETHTGKYELVSRDQNEVVQGVDVLLDSAQIKRVKIENGHPYLMAYFRAKSEEELFIELYRGVTRKGEGLPEMTDADRRIGAVTYATSRIPGGIDIFGMQLWFARQSGGQIAYRIMAPFDDWVSLGVNNTTIHSKIEFGSRELDQE